MPTDTDTTDTDTADTATATADTATATADTATATATATAIPTTPRVNRKVCQKCGAECERRFWVHTSADNHSHRELWCSSCLASDAIACSHAYPSQRWARSVSVRAASGGTASPRAIAACGWVPCRGCGAYHYPYDAIVALSADDVVHDACDGCVDCYVPRTYRVPVGLPHGGIVQADRRHPMIRSVRTASGGTSQWRYDPIVRSCPGCGAEWLAAACWATSWRPLPLDSDDVTHGPREVAVCPACHTNATAGDGGDPILGYGSSFGRVHPIGSVDGKLTQRGTDPKRAKADRGYTVPLLFGVEVEIACPDSTPTPEHVNRHARLSLGTVYAEGKRDSSIAPRGVEIVTHPATIGAHRIAWGNWRPPVGAVANESCGLHVHISRSALTTGQIDRLAYLLSRRHDLSRWSTIFRRQPNSYAKAMPVGSFPRRRWKDVASDRYHVLNLAGRETIEIRWPRGTVRGDVILATIELMHIMCHYVAAGNPGGSHTSSALCLDALLRWITTSPWARSETRTLRPYLVSRGILPQEKNAKPTTSAVDDGTEAHGTTGPLLGSRSGWSALRDALADTH
jgi:hypothetical protein